MYIYIYICIILIIANLTNTGIQRHSRGAQLQHEQRLRCGATVSHLVRRSEVWGYPLVNGKTMGKPWENHRKMVVEWDLMILMDDLPSGYVNSLQT